MTAEVALAVYSDPSNTFGAGKLDYGSDHPDECDRLQCGERGRGLGLVTVK
jgi:hypothetical protein